METNVTVSIDEAVLASAKVYATKNNMNLSQLTEFLFRNITKNSYASIEDLPIANWVMQVAEEQVSYTEEIKTGKDLTDEFYESRKKEMKLFIDANVLISVLNKEFPLFDQSARILSLAGSKYYQLYTSPTCFAIAYYFAEKRSGAIRAKEKITTLSNLINVALYEELDVKLVAANKKITDFEDGLVYMAAKNAACKYIITENIKDFHFSDIRALSCKSFLHQYLLA